ncbi:MAG: PE-PPE domain-containing protein [Mycobacteriaceae bacterium]|nr:PE-PPE domain-containing protein [Mycobacteriaceae bacterium]
MPSVSVASNALAVAAADLAEIGSAVAAHTTIATDCTAGLAAAAADEISLAAADLFRTYAQGYHALLAQAAEFQDTFVQTLTAAGAAYAEAEAASAAALSGGLTSTTPVSLPSALTEPVTALIMGGVGNPDPIPLYISAVQNRYIQPLYATAHPLGLWTPQQFWPTPGADAMTFGQSVSQGLTLLDAGIKAQLAAGNSVVVFGYSESATIASLHMQALSALPVELRPDPSQLSFVLIGNPSNPNGGLLARFPGLYIPILDVPFTGATPANTPYPTSMYTIQYDGLVDAPRYPLNILADANAFMGFWTGVHAEYPWLDPSQLANAHLLPTSPGYTGNTQYYLLLHQDLPLLSPIRTHLPYVGNALAELVQPDLRVLVDLGYGNRGMEYADISTPASLIQVVNPVTVSAYLAKGAVQGSVAALVELGVLPTSALPTTYPYVPTLSPGLSFNLPQSSVTGISLLTGAIGTAENALGLIPPWDYFA